METDWMIGSRNNILLIAVILNKKILKAINWF